jgi:hypothetical protein
MIANWKTLSTTDIQLYKPECTGSGRYILRSEYKNDDCFIQVPLSTIYKCEPTKKLSIGFPNVVDVTDKLQFITKMEEIDTWFHKQLLSIWATQRPNRVTQKKTKKKPTPSDIRWFPFIRWNPAMTNAYCSLSIQQEKIRDEHGKIVIRPYLEVFDRRKERLSIEAVEPYSYAYHIIHIDHIWIYRNGESESAYTAGVQWSVIQTRVYPSIFRMNECFIQEDTRDFPDSVDSLSKTSNANTAIQPTVSKEEHPTYGKYAKMKRMGIPDVAIEHKLKQDGYTLDEFLRWYSSNDTTTYTKKPSPVLPMSPLSVLSGLSSVGGLLSAIKGGNFALKKVSEDTSLSRVIPIQLKDKFTPPSKDELLQVIAKLRKS